MKLRLKRKFLGDIYTIGDLYVDDVFFCNTLEDKVRDLNKDGDLNDTGEEKVFGKTAIPYGTYNIAISYSPKFKRDLPALIGVNSFEGIRLHPGNDADDSSGCILVGINSEKGKVTQSKSTFERLFKLMKVAKYIEITIE